MTDGAQVPTVGGMDVALDVHPSTMTLGKRALDVLGSAAGLALLSPFFAITAALIAFDTPGGAIYRQRRVGLNGQEFDMFKFRTMRVGNDSAEHRAYVSRLITDGSSDLRGGDGLYKIDHDPRVTRVGRVLRRFSLDEFPQLLNVLRGEMSLVGPRPPLAYEVALYTPRHCRRLEAVPGMTGLWQVSGRNLTTFEQMIDLDLQYIGRRSMWLDLTILLKTVSVVLEAKGA